MPQCFLMRPLLNGGTLALRTMLNELTTEQIALARQMSDLSEKAYYAGWMRGLEYALWQLVLGERGDYGHLSFGSDDAGILKRLSQACGGWIVFDDEKEETWVPLAEWERRFSTWQASSAAKRVDG
jgi:hypothetical protein